MKVFDRLESMWIRAVAWVLDRVFHRRRVPALNVGKVSPQVGHGAPGDLRRSLNVILTRFMATDSQAIDYQALRSSEEFGELMMCTRGLRGLDLQKLNSREERLAFWINLYNALLVHAVIAYEIYGNILDSRWIFRSARYEVGGYAVSLDEIEHGILRGNRSAPYVPAKTFEPNDPRRGLVIRDPDPRIHFALHCGAKSCPPVAAYEPDRIDAQLDSAVGSFLESGGMVIDRGTGRVTLSSLFRWYRADFQRAGGLRNFLERHASAVDAEFLRSRPDVRFEWSPYDWTLAAA